MANGFDYESPLNRLLGATIPQFLNDQLDRQESSRRFDEQQLAQAQARKQNQANFNRQQLALEEQNAFEKQRVIKEDLYDIDSSLIDRINSEGNLDKKKILAEKFETQFKTERGSNEINAIMASIEDEKVNRQSSLDLFKGIGVLNDNEYTILSKNTSSSDYENQLNTTVNRSINQANLADNREFQAKFSDVKFIQSKITQLQRDKALTTPGSEQRNAIESELDVLNTELNTSRESLNQYFGGTSSGQQGSDGSGGVKTGMTTLKGGGIIPTAILNQFIAGEIDDVPSEYYTSFNDEDYDDLLVQEKLAQTRRKNIRQEAISSVPTAEKLTKKEQALLRRRRKQEEVLGSIDPTGQEAVQSIAEFLRNLQAPSGSMFKPAG